MSRTRTFRRRALAATALTTIVAIGVANAAGAGPEVPSPSGGTQAAGALPRVPAQTATVAPATFARYVHWRELRQAPELAGRPTQPQTAATVIQSGGASWYDGDGMQGACGVTLSGLYAASRTLPCGSLVTVRAGGRSVTVRILDRGPFVDGRILDLSPAAFQTLSPLGAGVIEVDASVAR